MKDNMLHVYILNKTTHHFKEKFQIIKYDIEKSCLAHGLQIHG
jgi:hypothetical protein